MKITKMNTKIKILIFYAFLFLILNSHTAASEAAVELSSDKQNYISGETIHVTLNLNPNGYTTGSVTIYEIINETKSKQYWQLFGTVPCRACAGRGVESIDEPFFDTFSRQMTEPGNYYVEANFGGVSKKVFFNVSESGKENVKVNETINETTNQTIAAEVNETENITEINEPANTAINDTKNLTNKPGIENDKTGIKNISGIDEDEDKTGTAKILIIIVLVLIAAAVFVIFFVARR